MSSYGGTVAILCAGIVFADVPSARPQDATSTNLPEDSEAGEPAPPAKSKKKKLERRREIAKRASTQTPTPASEQMRLAEEPVTAATPVQKKARIKKRAPLVQREMASIPPPTQLSLSAAQAMAVSAPLPQYPYEAKHANITGSGVCLMLVDTVTGQVTNATMMQSTGNRVLDRVTTDAFRRWRFKPGSISQIRVPVTYE